MRKVDHYARVMWASIALIGSGSYTHTSTNTVKQAYTIPVKSAQLLNASHIRTQPLIRKSAQQTRHCTKHGFPWCCVRYTRFAQTGADTTTLVHELWLLLFVPRHTTCPQRHTHTRTHHHTQLTLCLLLFATFIGETMLSLL